MQLSDIFSIKNNYKYNNYGIIISKHKVISILGIKIKLKQNNTRQIQSIINVIDKFINKSEDNSSENLINILIAIFSTDNELFCLKNNHIIYIFTKEFLRLDKSFVVDLLSFFSSNSTFYVLDKTSNIYKKLKPRIGKEICWRYMLRPSAISYFAIAIEDEKITFRRYFFHDENEIGEYIVPDNKLITYNYERGINLDTLIGLLKKKEQILVLKKFFNYIFENYTHKEYFDCVYEIDYKLANTVVNSKGEFVFIDFGAPKISKDQSYIKKAYCIYKILKHSRITKKEDLFEYFLNKFNIKSSIKECENTFELEHCTASIETKERYRLLFDKYFGLDAIIADMPQQSEYLK